MPRAAAQLTPDARPMTMAAMCNLYRMTRAVAEVANLFSATATEGLNAAADVYPGYQGLVVAGGEVRAMTWGFPITLIGKRGLPLKPKPVNNARFDKLSTYWKRWADNPTQRCLIPAERYAEAVGERGKMTTTWLTVKDASVFAWAGLWRRSDEWGDCYTGVMTDCDPGLSDIHDRAPVILEPDQWETWLNAPLADLYQFDKALPVERVDVQHTDKPWWQAKGT
jgi:putative SOS response-associated peptidase YedK